MPENYWKWKIYSGFPKQFSMSVINFLKTLSVVHHYTSICWQAPLLDIELLCFRINYSFFSGGCCQNITLHQKITLPWQVLPWSIDMPVTGNNLSWQVHWLHWKLMEWYTAMNLVLMNSWMLLYWAHWSYQGMWVDGVEISIHRSWLQYIPRNMHTIFALLCFVVVIHWLIFPYPPGLLHWHCGNLTIAPVPAKQPWWIWINNSCEFIMNDCITTTKQSTTKPCAYFLGYTVYYIFFFFFFGVLTYAIIYVLIHQIILRFYLLKYSLFFQVLLY